MIRPGTHPSGQEPRSLATCLERMQRGGNFRRDLMSKSSGGEWGGYQQPLLDAVELFDELGIGYALIGGIAAMIYGRSRFTEDIDFTASIGHEKLLADHPEAMKRRHFKPDCNWKLYHQSGVEIDLWKDDHSQGIVDRAVAMELAGRTVRVADPHDLIAMKLRADRPQDDYDISEIVRHTAIEDSRIQSLATAEQFLRYSAIKRRIGLA